MKPFSLEEYHKNPSRRVVTRDGREVRIRCTDRRGGKGQPIVALVGTPDMDEEYVGTYREDGRWSTSGCASDLDLFFAPEKHEGWFNIYHYDDFGFYIRQNQPYKSKEEADEVAKANFRTFFATVKVEWEE